MDDGRSEDTDTPRTPSGSDGAGSARPTAASDLLAMWVTGRSDREEAEPGERADAGASDDAPEPVAGTPSPAGTGAPQAEPEDEYVESLWPSDDPAAASSYAGEPAGGEQWWPYAAEPAEPAAAQPPVDPAPVPQSMDPRGLDMSTTASWTLADFERYVRHQEDNELAEWIGRDSGDSPQGGADAPGNPEAAVPAAAEPEEVDEAFSAAPTTSSPDEPVAPAPESVPGPGPTAVPLAAVPDLEPEDRDEVGEVLPADDETDVEWNPPEGEAPVEHRAAEAATPDDDWSSWDRDALRSEAGPAAAVEPETGPGSDPGLDQRLDQGPDPDQAALFPDEPASGPAPEDAPAPEPADEVWPAAPPVEPEPVAAVPAPEPEPAPEQPTWDLREWYDDYGLRWVSGDGGYTWYSDDGQGWDAEHSAVIPVEPGFVPFPGDPRSPGLAPTTVPASAPAPVDPAPTTSKAAAEPEPDPAPEAAAPAPLPDEPHAEPTAGPTTGPTAGPAAEPGDAPASSVAGRAEETGEDPDHWSRSAQDTSSFYAALAPQEDEATEETTSARVRRRRTPEPLAPERDGPGELPEHVEYRPRGAHRPLLILLFVVAAVVAVGAIFWAVSNGNQVVWGVAAGVTGLTLCFWWGLLSWTPTLVSVDGPMLEVSRGSDGERFDLRSPKLDIRVDEDVYSRAWRTTIVRPNGTELVIPSSAVDAEEFSRIVAHHRQGLGR